VINEQPRSKLTGYPKRKLFIEKPMVSQTLPCKETPEQAHGE